LSTYTLRDREVAQYAVVEMPSKGQLNKLIDLLVHKDKPVKDLPTLIVDEVLHSCVEGEFRLDKFVRYHVVPQLRSQNRPRKRLRRRVR